MTDKKAFDKSRLSDLEFELMQLIGHLVAYIDTSDDDGKEALELAHASHRRAIAIGKPRKSLLSTLLATVDNPDMFDTKDHLKKHKNLRRDLRQTWRIWHRTVTRERNFEKEQKHLGHRLLLDTEGLMPFDGSFRAAIKSILSAPTTALSDKILLAKMEGYIDCAWDELTWKQWQALDRKEGQG